MSVRQGNKVVAGGTVVTIDNSLSTTSVNPVQNHVITTALNNKQDTISAGSGISISDDTVAVSNLDCGTME